MTKSILFITKRRTCYGMSGSGSTGLLNSARFVVDMLVAAGIRANLVDVIDNNDIDREVTKYQPDIVIIEALWVVPSKFEVLRALHPTVHWVVRIHSEIPFLAYEGIAIEWIYEYLAQPSVYVGCNSQRSFADLQNLLETPKLLILPNYFPITPSTLTVSKPPAYLDVGCFGAIRPLKNQLLQAMAAIRYAGDTRQLLRFHINTRCEQQGDAILENIQALFAESRHMLVEHGWSTWADFQAILGMMDVSMCVSLSETFCLVAADSVSLGVPLVTSPEVMWSSLDSQAITTNEQDIVAKMQVVLGPSKMLIQHDNLMGLSRYNSASKTNWLQFVQ